ncbi:tRNA (adenosine(37)-N6)-threonylcarbamoyltransferase complex ATPase subunit type 1 TsaE [Glaciibacter psychrotolerans]|uniref:tRNA threonylcarbamoyladenosine biosynthesis protein TsaE n=1 Tax=Glaciibacter psychrotolerans TaxID=670054 RepID=A0A7Z0J7R5_9MICO|nr:tRNA (adenosine(37)-N6)-threonylcarbamoyltransferase complex ATPase subunit type 1 TsaE [Leifsonia psychrotolerans]NYJ21591.1 tRNA threonylcarbamoyl adenosine modification protein YjeE [Leifsonia psychrotolerans]
MQITIADADGMHDFGMRLAEQLRAGDLIVLTGPLGAGKTTLTRGLGEGLGVRGSVTSPTFVLARTHPSVVGGPPLVHVDAYRLSTPVELDDLDIDFVHSIVVIEWGRGMLDGVTDSWLDIEIVRPLGASQASPDADASAADASAAESAGVIEVHDVDEPRTVTITAHGPRWPAAPAFELARHPSE